MSRLHRRLGILCTILLNSMHAAEFPVDGYPPVQDPDDLGLRSAVIVFLKEHQVAYQPGIADEDLLALYRKYWDARRPAAKPEPPPRNTPPPASGPTAEEIDRDNLILLLRREYRFTDSEGKTLAELQEIHDRLRVAADTQQNPPESAAGGPGADQELGGNVNPKPAESPSPSAAKKSDVAVQPEAIPRIDSPALNPSHQRNRDSRSPAELTAASKAGELGANLQLARLYAYGLGVPMDLEQAMAHLKFLPTQKGGAQLIIDSIENQNDEVAAFLFGKMLLYDAMNANGVVYDRKDSLHFLKKAARGGCPHAYYQLWLGLDPDPEVEKNQRQYLLMAAVGGSLEAAEKVAADKTMWKEIRQRSARLAVGILALDPDFVRKPKVLERIVKIAQSLDDEETMLALHQAAAIAGSRNSQWQLGWRLFGIPKEKRTVEEDQQVRFWLGAAALRGHHNSMVLLAEVLHDTPNDRPPPIVPYKWLVRANRGQKPTGRWLSYADGLSDADIDLVIRDALTWIPAADGSPLQVPEHIPIKPLPPLATWATLTP